MSSDHIVIVARNTETGEVQLPLGDMTLYGVGDEDAVLATCCRKYGEEWVLALYKPVDDFWTGTKKERSAVETPQPRPVGATE